MILESGLKDNKFLDFSNFDHCRVWSKLSIWLCDSTKSFSTSSVVTESFVTDCLLGNMDAPGSDIVKVTGLSNSLECRKLCQNVPSCMAFVFVSVAIINGQLTTECALKHDVGEKVPRNFTFFGSKFCPGEFTLSTKLKSSSCICHSYPNFL